MPVLTSPSPAKINLSLHIRPLRGDGFHELESLVAQIDLCDEVSVEARSDGQITLACDDPTIPTDDSNLAVRAAHALVEHCPGNQPPGVNTTLRKRIPAGAGLGGGSSNAATTLRLLNELWEANLLLTQLAAIGATLGSDVPLFLGPKLCVMRGRGELIEPQRVELRSWVVLALPAVHCSTAAVYAAWDRLPNHPQRPPAGALLAHSGDVERLMAELFNDLEPAAFAVAPELGTLHARLQQHAGGPVRMTGSGSAFFRLFAEQDAAEAFARQVETEGIRAEVCKLSV